MSAPTAAQAGARLEVDLDRCHWAAIDSLRESGADYTAADVDRERLAREAAALALADSGAVAALWRACATSYLYGEGTRRKDRLAAELRRREGRP